MHRYATPLSPPVWCACLVCLPACLRVCVCVRACSLEALDLLLLVLQMSATTRSSLNPNYTHPRLPFFPPSQALQICDNEEEFHVPHVLIYDHVLSGVPREHIHKSYVEGRDVYWQDVIPKQSTECPVEWVEAEDPLFKLYTSGSTGKPKGVIHTTAGYMVGASLTFK